jgi:hypothetical protein
MFTEETELLKPWPAHTAARMYLELILTRLLQFAANVSTDSVAALWLLI